MVIKHQDLRIQASAKELINRIGTKVEKIFAAGTLVKICRVQE